MNTDDSDPYAKLLDAVDIAARDEDAAEQAARRHIANALRARLRLETRR